MSKILRRLAVTFYCIAIWLVLDFIYSKSIYVADTPVIRQDEHYSHGFVPNLESHVTWGTARYEFYSNSLGFRDAAVRDVPLQSTSRRILLIGDSFTEGLGGAYPETFAGLLAQAGSDRADKIEFLNAAVSSYSPTIYFKKIKYLIDNGLQFDEVVVLPDVNDVRDEALDYFCFDDDPRYRAYCRPLNSTTQRVQAVRHWLQTHFAMTNRVHRQIAHVLRSSFWTAKKRALEHPGATWTIPGYDIGSSYGALGVEGGIARARQNMQALADLLSARGIPLTLAVYPWPVHLERDDRDSRHVRLWREFCARNNCKDFIDTSPAFFAEKEAGADWYERLYIVGDSHFSAGGNCAVFRALVGRLLADPAAKNSGRAEQSP
jgi:hypothetical protein